MKCYALKTAWLALLATLPSSALADLPATFQQERTSPDPVTWSRLSSELGPYQVVFVLPRNAYFRPLRPYADNIRTIREDLHADAATARTDLTASYDENARDLAGQLLDLYATNGHKPLIVIGNAQTGPDSLYTVLKNPKLVTDGVVARLALVQAPFGSPVVDKVYEGAASDALTAAVIQLFGNKLQKFLTWTTRAMFATAIDSLAQKEPAALARISNETYYVRSSSTLLQVTSFPVISVPFLELHRQGPTDGISFTEDQKLDRLGRDLGVVSADHWDLFVSNPFSNSLPDYRESFTRALLRELLEP